MRTIEIEKVLKMPIEQKILLVEDMWDSIRPQSQRIPVLESHKIELDLRVKEYKNNPSALLSDQELKQALGSRG